MKGVVFNVVEEVVIARFGLEQWDAVVAAAGVDGAYTALGNYADSDLGALVDAAAEATGLPNDAVLRLVGIDGFASLASRVPELLADIHDWRTLLVNIDRIVHVEVDMLYLGAVTPRFNVEPRGDDVLMVYRSTRSMCALADVLAQGAARWFGAEVSVEHLRCTRDGDDRCELLVREVGRGC